MSPARIVPRCLACAAAVSMATSPARADVTPHAGMMRNPDISATHVVFVYSDDLWLVPREGGVATPLASPPGGETFPRFSPDGKTIAFVGNYEGNQDIYVIPSAGGPARRVTHHPAGETVCDWTPDGRILFFSSAVSTRRGTAHLYTVPPQGGLPEMLPLPYGANGSISADGPAGRVRGPRRHLDAAGQTWLRPEPLPHGRRP